MAVVAASACFAYRPASLTPSAGGHVRLIFTNASNIAIRAPESESTETIVTGVLEASGIVAAVSRDTLALRLGALRTDGGLVPGVANHVALIPVERIALVTERRVEAGRTALAGIGVLTLAMTVLVLLLVVTVTKAAV